jgi:type I restriction enzyme S subunit
MSKNKLIPELRFPDFLNAGEWQIEVLQNLSQVIVEKTKGRKYKLMSITSGVGLVSQLEKFGREIAGNSYKNYYVIRNGDFAYNKSSTKLYSEGEIALFQNDEIGAVPNSIFTCFRFDQRKVYPTFAKYPFVNNIHGNWLRNFISVGARANGALQVNNKDLFLLPFPFPNLQEQQKIASCLSSLNEVIAAHSQKLEALKDHKKGLMQNLFPQMSELGLDRLKDDKIKGKEILKSQNPKNHNSDNVPKYRFPEFLKDGEWVEKKLGVVLDFVMGNAFKSNDFVENGVQLIRMGNLYQGVLQLNRIPVFLPDNFVGEYQQFLVKPRDLLMSMTGTLGKRDYGFVLQIPANSSDLLLNQRVIKLVPKEGYIKEFVLQVFKNESFLQKLYSIPGGTKQANLSTKDLKEIKISFPKLTE